MRIIVGLGNPGLRYRKTRHNLGFRVLDALATEAGIAWKKKRKFSAWLGRGTWEGEPLIVVKPVTYVNDSGRAVRAVLDYFEASSRDLLVVVDDVNLPPGTIRIRSRGGAGGHHGLESVIRSIGIRDFARLRIGVGGGGLDSLTGHVLSRPTGREEVCYLRAVSGAVEAIAEIFRHGIEKAMNKFNRKEVPNNEEAKD